MANTKISALTSASTPLTGTEVVPVVQSSTTKKVTTGDLLTGTVPSGTANGVMYLNGSKVATTSSGLVFDSSGNLGLGVTPSAWVANAKAVHIGSFLAAWTGSNGSSNLGFGVYEGGVNTYNYRTTGDAPTMYSQLTGAHRWFTAPSGTAGNAISFTQAMTLDAGGNLLVGTTTASGILSIGAFSATGATQGYAVVDNGRTHKTSVNTAAAAAHRQFFNTNGIVGSITTEASITSYNTSSDSRLKENIHPAEDSASLIDAIQVRQYDWKSDGSHQRYGMVAQELDQVFPEAVSKPTDPEEMMGVDYSKLVPLLLKEIQSLRARVAALEAN